MAQMVVIIICLGSFFGWVGLLGYKYFALQYHDWDLAFFVQAMWGLSHGSTYVSLTGINFFGDHAYLITFLILPIFGLIPHPVTLLVLKVISYVMSGYLFYQIVKKELGERAGLIMMILYLSAPPNVFAMLYEFNPENFSPPLIFLMWIFFKENRWKAFLIASLFLISIKENMCLVVAVWGLYGLFVKKDKINLGVVPLFLGILIFILSVCFLIPHFRGTAEHPLFTRYHLLGGNLVEVLTTMVVHPVKILRMILDTRNLGYLAQLFGPLILPAFLSPQILFLASPLLLQHLLASDWAEHTILYHYGSSLMPFIFLASVNTLHVLRPRISPKIWGVVLSSLLIFSFFHVVSFQHQYYERIRVRSTDGLGAEWKMIKDIPPDAAVVASFHYLPPLSTRARLYSFHTVYDEYYQNRAKVGRNSLLLEKTFQLPEDVSFALIDFNDPWLKSRIKDNPREITLRIRNFFLENHWRVRNEWGKTILFEKGQGR